MIQVYLQENKLAKCRAVQVYADGRPSRNVDFQYLADGATPDPAVCHGSIVKRFAAGEQIQEIPYPNECYPLPSPPPAAKDIRAARYKEEADPLLLAALGYAIELEAKPGDSALIQKQATAKADYLAAKAKIRAEVKDA